MAPYEFLGFYVPERNYSAKKIGLDIVELAGQIPLPIGAHRLHKGQWKSKKLHADVFLRQPGKTADLDWHKDGDMSGADTNCCLVLWADMQHTQFLYGGTVYQPPPWSVILVPNIFHRRPAGVLKHRRSFRQRVMPCQVKKT